MIKEAIELLLQRGEDAKEPKLLAVPNEPDHVHHLITGDGTLALIENVPKGRTITCTRISDFVGLINRAGDDDYFGKMFLSITPARVRLIFDTANGRECATMDLEWTNEFRAFNQLGRGEPYMSPQKFRSMLRYEVPQTMPADAMAKLVKQVSSFESVNRARNDASIERGGESMGASVQAEVKGGELGLPDEKQVFNVRLYVADDLPHRYPIECVLDPDTQQNRWILVPLEHSLLTMFMEAKNNIAEMIRNGIEGEVDVQITYADYSQAYK